VTELRPIRALTEADLPGCQKLTEAFGWPWEEPKWRLLLQFGHGFAVDATDGRLVGTVVLNAFRGEAASIGLMGVAPDWGRRGVGRALMARALEKAGGVPTFLYATPQGAALYARLGFRVAGTIHKYVGRVGRWPEPATLRRRRMRRMRAEDLDAVATLDAIAFGAPRSPYLDALFHRADQARVAEGEDGRLVGYGIGWSVGQRRTLGPLVALDDGVAESLASGLLEGQPKSVRMDIPSGFPSLERWALGLGLVPAPPAPLMVLNAEQPPGRREWLYTVAMQGLG
jgi:ribosomal protein S18 acetylase RimI-like enzyme